MDQELRAAFRAARYRFDSSQGELLLQVDVQNPALATWMGRTGVDQATVLTAFNPHGRQQEVLLNCAAQAQLHRTLLARGFVFLIGQNEDPSGIWPPEESFLIAGLGLAEAHALAHQHGQLAFLWSGRHAIPELRETQP